MEDEEFRIATQICSRATAFKTRVGIIIVKFELIMGCYGCYGYRSPIDQGIKGLDMTWQSQCWPQWSSPFITNVDSCFPLTTGLDRFSIVFHHTHTHIYIYYMFIYADRLPMFLSILLGTSNSVSPYIASSCFKDLFPAEVYMNNGQSPSSFQAGVTPSSCFEVAPLFKLSKQDHLIGPIYYEHVWIVCLFVSWLSANTGPSSWDRQ